MKKMLLLLASLACFGLLASCSDETQDVYVTNNAGVYKAAGVMTGAMTSTETGITYAIDNTRYAFVSASQTNADMVTYTLTVPYTYTIGNSTTKAISTQTVTKIAGKYYKYNATSSSNNTPVIANSLEVDGSLEDSFTVKSDIKVSSTITISNLKFEKK